MNPKLRRSRHAGLSLIETMVVLVVGGVVVTVASHLLSVPSTQSRAIESAENLNDAQRVLVGYLRGNLHMPDSDAGWLPRSLSSNLLGNRVRYFVAKSLVDVPTDRFNPHELMVQSVPNGLDLCRKIARTKPADLLQLAQGADSQRVAVVLEYSTAGRVSGSPSEVAMPGTALAAQREQEGTFSRAIGIGELFAELQCPDRIGRSAAAAKYVWAMQDMVELAKSNTTLKRYDLDVAQAEADASSLGLAQLAVSMAVLLADHINTTASLLGKLPEVPVLKLGVYTANFVLAEALLGRKLASVDEAIRAWPAAAAAKRTEIEAAQAKQAIVEAALADSMKELRELQLLGLSK